MPVHPVKKPAPGDVARLHAEGRGRNETARILGVSRRQVDRVAQKEGLAWDTTRTANAVAARRQSAEDERLDLGDGFRELALDCVTRALQEEDTAERRRLVLTAEAATRSDLALHNVARDDDGGEAVAARQFAELLTTIRGGFETIENTPIEDLERYPGEFD